MSSLQYCSAHTDKGTSDVERGADCDQCVLESLALRVQFDILEDHETCPACGHSSRRTTLIDYLSEFDSLSVDFLCHTCQECNREWTSLANDEELPVLGPPLHHKPCESFATNADASVLCQHVGETLDATINGTPLKVKVLSVQPEVYVPGETTGCTLEFESKMPEIEIAGKHAIVISYCDKSIRIQLNHRSEDLRLDLCLSQEQHEELSFLSTGVDCEVSLDGTRRIYTVAAPLPRYVSVDRNIYDLRLNRKES